MSARASRLPTTAEIVADGVVHALGVGVGLPAAIALVVLTAFDRTPANLAPIAVYAAGLAAMFVCSAAYNLLRNNRLRAWLQRLDHAAIFAMIAGTYTPFIVLRLDGAWAVALAGAVWAIAGLGIVAKLLRLRWIEPVSVGLYLLLGWIGLVAIGPFMHAMDVSTLALLGAGGLLYTVGVIFHLWRALPFQNAIWHAFVLLGAGLHYGAVLTVV
ncbi:MAG TPA: hemolysin III family protein [Reyranella sp.]|jgi:hemolysin III|nr:hemolysin III family protein [Reyranella sp.]